MATCHSELGESDEILNVKMFLFTSRHYKNGNCKRGIVQTGVVVVS